MKTITITQKIMDSIKGMAMIETQSSDWNEELQLDEVIWNDCHYWFNADGLDDSNNDCFLFDATWIGDNSEESVDEGEWSYSVQVGDVVELL